MNTKIALKTLFRFVLWIVALSLCYLTVEEYLNGPTSTFVSKEPISINDLPDLTVCWELGGDAKKIPTDDEDEDLDEEADPEIEEDPENDFVIIDKSEIIPGIQVPAANSTNRATEEDSTTTTPSSSDEASSTDVGFSRYKYLSEGTSGQRTTCGTVFNAPFTSHM